MSVRHLSCILGTLAIAIAILVPGSNSSIARASVLYSNSIECGHPRGSDDAKRLAKHAWQKPYGPSKSDRRNWKVIKACARTSYQREVRFPHMWNHYKSKYADDRLLLRLKDSCGQSPTSAVVKCIEYASVVHGYPLTTLYRIATCESHLNPYAGNPSGASGLFQFMSSTFSNAVSRMRADGFENGGNIYSALDNATAAAYKMGHDGTGEWVCQ